MSPLGIGLTVALGAAAGWVAAEVARRVLAEREEELAPMPGWVGPVAAIVTAALFAATGYFIGAVWVLPAYLWFVALTVTLMITDIHSRLIPNRINYPGTTIGALLLAVGAVVDGEPGGIVRAAIGAAIYFAITTALFVLGRGRSFGGGDVKLSVVLGIFSAYLGWDVFVAAVVLGFLVGGLAGVLLLLTRSRGLKDHFAFGPPLTVGAYVAIAYGEGLMEWYLS